MAHKYSLRPNTKGRQSYQSNDETGSQVEGTSTGTTTSNSSSEGQHKLLTGGDSSTIDPIPATPDTPREAHNSPGYSDSSIMVTSSAISASNASMISKNRRAEEDHHRPSEASEEIEASQKREEARRSAEVIRIRQEQLVKGYKQELALLHARITALRAECEKEVDQLKKEWEEAQAFERGEVLVVVEDPRLGLGHGRGGKKNLPRVVGLETTLPSQSSAPLAGPSRHGSENNFLPRPPPLRRTQQQQLHLSQRQRQQEDDHGPHPHPQPQLQPLQRQPTRLMAMPTLSSHPHHGLHHTPTHTYGTYGTPAILDPGTEVYFGGTDGDNDSEMGEPVNPCSDSD